MPKFFKAAPAAASSRSPKSPIVTCEGLESRRLLSTTVTITADRAQTIDGFGTSLGGTTSTSLIATAKFQKAYYRDLGASMFRVAMNPWLLKGTTVSGKKSIGTAVTLGPHVEANAALFDFTNGNIKKYGTLARAAAKYGSEVSVIGSVWSPPYWMKGEEISSFNGQPNGVTPTFNDATGNTAGGSLIATEANLTQFGRYVAAYVYGFQKAYGVKLTAISIQNELAFHESYSSAVYSPDLYVKAVKAVSRWLKKSGLDTEIMGPEDVGVGSTSDTGILNRQMAYVKALRKDPDALAAVDVYAIHGYADDGVLDQRSPEMWARYWSGQTGNSSYATFSGIKADHKHSWMTETSGYSSTWNATLRLASDIQDALVQGNVSAFVYWGISNTTDNGESLMKGADTAANKYNAFKAFSKYVRPGAVRLQTSKTDPAGVYASAFADDQAKTITSVLVNNTDKAQDVTIKLDGLSLARFGTAYASTEGETWKAQKSLRLSHGRMTFTMAARSIETLVGSTGPVAAAGGTISGVYFLDTSKNGKQDGGEKPLPGAKVYLDLDADGVRDRREPLAVTNASGAYAFTGLAKGVYRVRPVAATGYTTTTPAVVTRLKTGHLDATGVYIGVAKTSTPTTPSGKASITGHAFADTNGNGRQDSNDPDAAGKTVYLDADNDGTLDSGETRTTTDSDGNFTFTGLAAGTYHVRRVFGAGYTASTTTAAIVLTAGEKKTGVSIGSRAK